LSTDHHWIGVKPNPHEYFGFIYVITDVTAGRYYVGKKQYWAARRIKGCRSKVTDKRSSKWKSKCWSESDWRFYKGSSKNLQAWMEDHPTHQYEYRIVKQCRAKGTLHYSEIEALVRSGCLWIRSCETGEPLFFNRQIPACKFRPQDFYGEEEWLIDVEGLVDE